MNTITSTSDAKKIAVVGDLPSGGGELMYKAHLSELRKKYHVTVYRGSKNKRPTNIVAYYKRVLSDIFKNYKLSDKINKNYDIVIAYQSWITKSPIIFPWINIPIVYICNEVPREHYDVELRKTYNIKEWIINNLLLLPIKIIDYLNINNSRIKIKIVTLSKISREMIREVYKINPKIIYPGISNNGYGKYNEYSNRKNQVVCVGAINKYKNQLYIIKVVSKIPKTYRPKVVLVGNGGNKEYIDYLTKYAKTHSVTVNVRLNINRKKLIDIYKNSIALFYAPINEPFGLVVLEGMRAGLPILVSNNGGGYLDVVNERNGYILENNINLWAKTYVDLINSRSVWQDYSSYNVKYASKFTDTSSSNMLTKYIDKIIR